MANYCSISCGICDVVEQGSGSDIVTSRYKLCVERALDTVVATSLNTLERFNVSFRVVNVNVNVISRTALIRNRVSRRVCT